MAVKKRAYFTIDYTSDESKCTITFNNSSMSECTLQYKEDGTSTWSDVTENKYTINFKGVTKVSFRAHPNDGNTDYEDYQIDVTVTYVEEYQISSFISVINASNEYVSPSTTLVFEGETAYFDKCGYCGYKKDSHDKYGIYANPARYNANFVKRFEVRQQNVLPTTVSGTRTSIINFYNTNNQKIEQLMVRGKVIDASDNGNTDDKRIFPSDGDANKIMSIRKSSNYSFDPKDTNLSNLFVKSGINGLLSTWYYVVNGIQRKISNILDHSFTWQAALTDKHKNAADPRCSDQTNHYAIYNLYPEYSASTYKVEFYDAYGNHLSNQIGQLSDWYEYTYQIDYQNSVYPPTNLKTIQQGKTLLFHSGWIDSTDGLQANLAEVTHDMKCIPYYSQSIQDLNGIVETDDLKKYMIELIQMQCDNVDEFYVSHEYYKSEYSRTYENLRRTIDSSSFKYLSHVSTSTLEKNVTDYMSRVDVLLDEYKDKVMTLGLVFLYYLSILYFIKNTVVYVHGYKHESLGDYNSCHVMYVPDNVPDFEEYIKNFSLIQDTIDILIDTQDQYDIIYNYSGINSSTIYSSTTVQTSTT